VRKSERFVRTVIRRFNLLLKAIQELRGRVGAMLPEDECATFEVVDFFARFLRSVTAETGVAVAVEALATL
jgi:hypothetical protein